MKSLGLVLAVVGLLLGLLGDIASAHSGRRFNIYVVEGRLEAQGINTGPADGAPATRPYPNAIHDHWRNVPGVPAAATASLPGFDVPPRSDISLWGQRLDLELISASKWVNPPAMPGPGTVPVLTSLDAGERVVVNGPQGVVTSDSLGTLALLGSVSPSGSPDLDLLYEVNRAPAGELHVLEMILRATPANGGLPTLLPSRPIFVVLAPDAATTSGAAETGVALPGDCGCGCGSGCSCASSPSGGCGCGCGGSAAVGTGLHGAALFLEQYLATAVPEPASVGIAVAAFVLVAAWRTRRHVQ